ncbi:hypothetical protein PR048_026343 [Dryococelus australis]|uniref:Uncharacterized protein n=1 Tax=Dryococelus australis TaxID=614101 RepID=A0ABQ9GL36_9NEOP|nr:hypothetical protein PR048_026343 [Dryococelus australis]
MPYSRRSGTQKRDKKATTTSKYKQGPNPTQTVLSSSSRGTSSGCPLLGETYLPSYPTVVEAPVKTARETHPIIKAFLRGGNQPGNPTRAAADPSAHQVLVPAPASHQSATVGSATYVCHQSPRPVLADTLLICVGVRDEEDVLHTEPEGQEGQDLEGGGIEGDAEQCAEAKPCGDCHRRQQNTHNAHACLRAHWVNSHTHLSKPSLPHLQHKGGFLLRPVNMVDFVRFGPHLEQLALSHELDYCLQGMRSANTHARMPRRPPDPPASACTWLRIRSSRQSTLHRHQAPAIQPQRHSCTAPTEETCQHVEGGEGRAELLECACHLGDHLARCQRSGQFSSGRRMKTCNRRPNRQGGQGGLVERTFLTDFFTAMNTAQVAALAPPPPATTTFLSENSLVQVKRPSRDAGGKKQDPPNPVKASRPLGGSPLRHFRSQLTHLVNTRQRPGRDMRRMNEEEEGGVFLGGRTPIWTPLSWLPLDRQNPLCGAADISGRSGVKVGLRLKTQELRIILNDSISTHYSPPTKANRVRFPAGSLPNFCMFESCWTMPLVGGFPQGSPVSPALSFQCCSTLTFTLVGSQDLDDKSRLDSSLIRPRAPPPPESSFIRRATPDGLSPPHTPPTRSCFTVGVAGQRRVMAGESRGMAIASPIDMPVVSDKRGLQSPWLPPPTPPSDYGPPLGYGLFTRVRDVSSWMASRIQVEVSTSSSHGRGPLHASDVTKSQLETTYDQAEGNEWKRFGRLFNSEVLRADEGD